jgi:SAM-dependent methyltransferase
MLAPRKTLWSTPTSAVEHLQKWIPLRDNDKICDIGCGDGRILLEWAQRVSSATTENVPKVSFLGIDIDPDRIAICQDSLNEQRQNGKIHEHLTIEFVCANALESTELFDKATVFFLYLIPRGLKLIQPLLQEHKATTMGEGPLHVVSYMAKLPGETVTDRALLEVEHQPGAAWPLYYYRLS